MQEYKHSLTLQFALLNVAIARGLAVVTSNIWRWAPSSQSMQNSTKSGKLDQTSIYFPGTELKEIVSECL